MKEKRNVYSILVGKTEEKRHLQDPGVGEIMTLKLILKKQDGRMWTVFIWLRVGSCCEHGSELPG
jgi:hypothetical protein